MDDLIKRLRRCFNGLEGLQTDQGDYGVLAEAATALTEAQATIARQQVMLDRALESNGDMMVRIGKLEEALREIVQWSDAYPTEVFPEPDFARAAAALSAVSMSLDVVSASNMRHATKGVGNIARAALAQGKEDLA